MPDLSQFSEAELKAELEHRTSTPQAPPVPLPSPDWKPLVECITGGVAQMVKDQFEDEDFKHYVYEAAIRCLYGPSFWIWRRAQRY